MCGRFTLAFDLDQIAAEFKAKIGGGGLWEWEPAYNIAPGTVIPVIAYDGQRERKLCLLYTSPSPRDKRQSRMPSSA